MKPNFRSIAMLLVTSLLVGTLSAAQHGVSIHKLDNGMQILLIENRALPMVGVNVVVKTGSAYETYTTSGMSHMLEHLLFNGTTHRTQRELYDATDLIGGYNNANTGDYYTNFMMVMPAEHQVAGMEIQADMLFNSTLPAAKFEKEQGIVLEEIAQGRSNSDTQMEHDLMAELFKGHALSLPTLGTYSTVEHLTRDAVYQYYRSTYLPNNMILSAIGNFDSATMLKDIDRIYGAAAPGSVFRPSDSELKTGMTPPAMAGLTPGMWLDRYYSGQDIVLHQIYSLPEDLPTGFVTLLEAGLDAHLEGLKSKLDQRFPGDVASLDLEFHVSPIANYLAFKVVLNHEQKATEISSQLHEQLKRLKVKIAPAKLAALAASGKTDFLRNTEKPHMFGIYNAYDFATRGIDGVLALPTAAELGQTAQILKKFRLKQQPAVILHHPQPASSQVEDAAVKTTLIQGADQGMGLIAQQNTSSELLAIHYLFKYKAAYEAQYGQDAAKILHDCFGQRMQTPEKVALSQQFGLKFTVNDNPWIPMDNIYLHPDFGYIRVEGLAHNMADAVDFLNSELNGFSPTPQEFDKAVKKFSRGMPHGGKDAAQVRFNTLRDSVLYGTGPETIPPELTYQGLQDFATKYFAPTNRIVSVVSPAAASQVAKQFLVAGTRSASPTLALSERGYQKPTQSVDIDVKGGGERSYLFWGFIKQLAPEDAAAVKALGLILSDRISFNVREKQGLAYRMSATVRMRDNQVLFYISLGTRPDNAAVLIPQFPELMSRASLTGLDEPEVQKAINMYLGRMMFRRLSSINQAYYLGTSLFFHQDMNYDQAALDALKKVTLADVQRVAKKYLQVEHTLSVVVR